MKRSHEIQEEINLKNAQCAAITDMCADADREPTDEEQQILDKFFGLNGHDSELDKLENLRKSRLEMETRTNEIAQNRLGSQLAVQMGRQQTSRVTVPAQCRRHAPLRAFDNDEDAYTSGRWFLAKIFNHEPSNRWLRDHGIMNQQAGGTSGQGAELVTETLEAAILKRLEQLSPIRQKARMTTMLDPIHKIPDRLDGVTVYYPDENAAITESHMTFGQQTLTARKMACLTQVSSELNEDSVISVMDELAMDIAYQFSQKENDDAFNGDGTATYGSVTGLANALDANSVVTGAGVTASTFTLANYESCVALNPFFQGSVPEWYMSSAVWASSALPLLNAAGGTPGSEISSGYQPRFMGFPVNIVQVMDAGTTVSTNQVYFGTLSQSVFFGTRRGVTIATSEHYGFNTDSVFIRGTQRNAITVDNHDAATAGSVTAIATTAS